MPRFNLQLFADQEPTPPAPSPTPPTPAPSGKVYSEEYVQSLRNESAGYRTKAKTYESDIRQVLGIKDDEDIGDVKGRLTSAQQTALTSANNRIIAAEIKSLEGYDTELLMALMDKSTLKINDKGEVEGLKEAAEAVAKKYPKVLGSDAKADTRKPFAPPNPIDSSVAKNSNQAMNDLIRGKR